MSGVELRGVTAGYGSGPPVIHAVDLTIGRSEMLVLLGPSGAGKTTTLRAIAGLLSPSAGDVRMGDRSVNAVPPERRGTALVFQEDTLFPFRTVRENVEFGLRMRRVNKDQRSARIAEALEAVHLVGFDDRWPDQLSGGERRRVALAQALAVEPDVLLLDEPLSSLEPSLRAELCETISEIHDRAQTSILLVTHDQAEAAALADRVALMVDGRVRHVGPPGDFFHEPADAEIARFVGAGNFLAGQKHGARVRTAIGNLDVTVDHVPDGPVLVLIPPEAIEIGIQQSNSFTARVDSSRLGARFAECVADIGGTSVHFTAPKQRRPLPGEAITLHLPADAIGVLPTPDR